MCRRLGRSSVEERGCSSAEALSLLERTGLPWAVVEVCLELLKRLVVRALQAQRLVVEEVAHYRLLQTLSCLVEEELEVAEHMVLALEVLDLALRQDMELESCLQWGPAALLMRGLQFVV